MGLVSTIEKKTNDANVWLRSRLVRFSEKQNIRRKRSLIDTVHLSHKQEEEIKSFYKTYYGKEIPTTWHRLYQSYTGEYHVDYFPEFLFSTKLEPKVNPYREAEFLGDKNLLGTLFSGIPDLHIPQTFVSCVRGILRDSTEKIITQKEAEQMVRSMDEFVIKKTRDTSSGRDVHVYRGNEDPTMLLGQFGTDYVVQEKIVQHDSLALLNPTSVNTFRVITYLCDQKIYVCPVALRMGRSNADKDNIHYGGSCVGVNNNGALMEKAFSEYGESYSRHPDTNTVFLGYSVPLREVVEVAVRMHSRIPYLGILSWDLTVDESGKPVIVEMNSTGQSAWFCQMVNGKPLFGENTSKMLTLIK